MHIVMDQQKVMTSAETALWFILMEGVGGGSGKEYRGWDFFPRMASKQINARSLHILECYIPERSLHSHCIANRISYLLLCNNLSQNLEA